MKSRKLPPGMRTIDGGKAPPKPKTTEVEKPKRDTRAKHLACPRGMTKAQQKVFKSIARHLSKHHMLHSVDAPTLRQFAEVTVRRNDAQAIIDTDGMMVKSSTGSRIRHPMLITIEKCDSQRAALFKELGLTPGARARRGQS